MANGKDKNGIRLCDTIAGFRLRHCSWPTRISAPADIINDLRHHVYTAEEFSAFEAKLNFVEDEKAAFIAEDDEGHSYQYGEDETPLLRMQGISITEWLGLPKPHPPRWLKRLQQNRQI